MERNFLGINGEDSGAVVKEESRGGRQDSAYIGGSTVQWPFSNKIAALQQFMSFKAVQEEKPKKIAFDHLSSSGFQPITTSYAFESSHKASTVQQAPQKGCSLDSQGAHQFSMHAYQPQSNDSFGASSHHVVSHHSIPVATSSPFFKIHGSLNGSNLPVTTGKQQPIGGIAANNASVVGSGVGAFASRNVTKPSTATAQLTIFYAGSVNVYDDVPLDKAQAIMFLASKGCNATSNTANSKQEAPVTSIHPKVAGVDGFGTNHTQTQTQTQYPNHVLSSISATSHGGAHSRSGSSTTSEVAGTKSVGTLPTPLSQREPSKAVTTTVPVLPRAVPQARNASLARFLEKRKERVTNTMPYSCAKNSPEKSTGFKVANASSKCSSADISLSSNREESWCLGHPKNSNSSRDSPSTKLKM